MQTNFIDLKQVSHQTCLGIGQFLLDTNPNAVELRDKFTDHRLITVDELAPLWFILRSVKDDPSHFPKGKWAVLQHLETLLDRACQADEPANLAQDLADIV